MGVVFFAVDVAGVDFSVCLVEVGECEVGFPGSRRGHLMVKKSHGSLINRENINS